MDYLGKKCPICSERFHENDDIVVCPECGAPYHRECYRSKGACIFPELHEKRETWHDPETDQDEDEDVVCPHCGRHNNKNNVLCVNCGKMLHLKDVEVQNSRTEGIPNTSEQSPFINMNGTLPFAMFDPMGGVAPEENFDGVSGAEIAKTVKVNTPYYMSVFKAMKETGISKFNFAALVFGGGWLLYRKQYLKGGIITAFTALLVIVQDFLSYGYAANIWKAVQSNLENAHVVSANITTYMTELFKLSTGEIIVALLPYVCSFIVLAISIILGFTANKAYYKHIVKKIKSIKQEKDESEWTQTFDEKGGVNRGIAYTLLFCEFLISVMPFFFY